MHLTIDAIIMYFKLNVVHPLKHPEHALKVGVPLPKGIIVYGPSGVGKTKFCSALATEAGLNFLHIDVILSYPIQCLPN
jgi:ATP-dependent 26S proteasome regulatory subunit